MGVNFRFSPVVGRRNLRFCRDVRELRTFFLQSHPPKLCAAGHAAFIAHDTVEVDGMVHVYPTEQEEGRYLLQRRTPTRLI